MHGLMMKMFVLPLLRYVYEDMRNAEAYLGTTNVDWTVVRAPYLTDGPLTGKYRIAEKLAPPKGTKLSRADLGNSVASLRRRRTIFANPPWRAHPAAWGLWRAA